MVHFTYLHIVLFNVTVICKQKCMYNYTRCIIHICTVKGRQSYSQSDNVLPFENNLRFGKGFDDEFATSNKILW